jgi:hypothetical protein
MEVHRVVRHRGLQTAVRSALCAGRPFPPGRFLVLISVMRLSGPQGHNAAGRIRSIEKSNDFFGNRTRDLPIYSIVLQPTTLPRPPCNAVYIGKSLPTFRKNLGLLVAASFLLVSCLDPEDGGSIFFRNIGGLLPNYTSSDPPRSSSSRIIGV